MKKRAFTIMEIIIVVAVIGILATLAFPAYKNVIENSKARVCETNLQALNTALEIYAMDHDVMPGDLSELPPEDVQKAYARILQEKGAWKIKLAYFIVGQEQRGLVYAGLLTNLAGGNISLMTCPADHTPPAEGGISYGLNSALASMTSQVYRALPASALLIGDSDTTTFTSESSLKERHKYYNNIINVTTYSLSVSKAKKSHVKKVFKLKAKRFLRKIEDEDNHD